MVSLIANGLEPGITREASISFYFVNQVMLSMFVKLGLLSKSDGKGALNILNVKVAMLFYFLPFVK